jgi:sialidase-1
MKTNRIASHAATWALAALMTTVIVSAPWAGAADVKTDTPHRFVVAPVGPGNNRNSEADIIQLKDGSLFLAWTDFYEGGGADHAPARIAGKISKDRGMTWGEEFVVVENDGGCNVMEVNFLRLKNDDIALFYCQKNSERKDCRVMMRRSSDEGKTWGEALQMSPAGKYTGLTNGRCIRLKTGRILLESWEDGDAYCCISDDDGKTWHDGGRVKPEGGPCYEPSCIELKDGSVMILMRTSLGGQFKSISKDGGETWSKPELTALKGTAAPVSISRVPGTGDLLAIWNHNAATPMSPGNTNRTPLTAAISKDEGVTWEQFRNIEEGSHDAWAYPAVTWVDNDAFLTYFTYTGGISLVFRIIPSTWFYGK